MGAKYDMINGLHAVEDNARASRKALRQAMLDTNTAIEMPPTWEALVPLMIANLKHGRNTSGVETELLRMAKLADRWVECEKLPKRTSE